jgi:hypothetical protein
VTDPLSLDTTHLVIQQASGNVGIGTMSPEARLTIQQSEAGKKALSVSGDGGASFNNQAGDLGIDLRADSITAAGANQGLTIAARGTGALLLNPAGGHLGIRTDKLNLASTADVVAAIESKSPDPLKKATDGVLTAIKNEATPTPRLLITGDVIILGRLLVTDISEYGGKVYRRGGQT